MSASGHISLLLRLCLALGVLWVGSCSEAEKPINRDEFAQLNGVGASKLDKYAASFLAVLAEYAEVGDQPAVDSALATRD